MDSEIERATGPARWLLGMAATEGIPLTEGHAIARAVVQEGVERWPHWFDAELFGPPRRELEVRALEELHAGMRRLKLLYRRGRSLKATSTGREMLERPDLLLGLFAEDLTTFEPAGEVLATVFVATLTVRDAVEVKELSQFVGVAMARAGWGSADGEPLGEWDAYGLAAEFVAVGEVYGLFAQTEQRSPGSVAPWLISLSDAGRQFLAPIVLAADEPH